MIVLQVVVALYAMWLAYVLAMHVIARWVCQHLLNPFDPDHC